MFEKSSLLVNAFYAKLDQGVVESLIRDADLLYSVVNSRSGRNENMIFYIDRDMNAILGGIEKIGTNLTEDVFYKEHTPVKSNLPTFRLGLEIKKILVVDDNPDIIFTLRSIFEEYPERFLVSTYTNPTEVPHTFQTNYYDLALIDQYANIEWISTVREIGRFGCKPSNMFHVWRRNESRCYSRNLSED
jgi:hypothetical protein